MEGNTVATKYIFTMGLMGQGLKTYSTSKNAKINFKLGRKELKLGEELLKLGGPHGNLNGRENPDFGYVHVFAHNFGSRHARA